MYIWCGVLELLEEVEFNFSVWMFFFKKTIDGAANGVSAPN